MLCRVRFSESGHGDLSSIGDGKTPQGGVFLPFAFDLLEHLQIFMKKKLIFESIWIVGL